VPIACGHLLLDWHVARHDGGQQQTVCNRVS
jgi:hypothetical protein